MIVEATVPDSAYVYVCMYVCICIYVYDLAFLLVFTEDNDCKSWIYVARLAIDQEISLTDILPGLLA